METTFPGGASWSSPAAAERGAAGAGLEDDARGRGRLFRAVSHDHFGHCLTSQVPIFTDVLLFALAHPRWEFVFQPKYAAYLNLIEPWWKVLRSLALKGRRFEAWPEIEEAVRRATAYWNEHKHPFLWGRRRRHRTLRRPGIAVVSKISTTYRMHH